MFSLTEMSIIENSEQCVQTVIDTAEGAVKVYEHVLHTTNFVMKCYFVNGKRRPLRVRRVVRLDNISSM
jgi:hypothetical protein